MTEEEIIETCKYYNIEDYRLNYDMSVDVTGYVNFNSCGLDQIPLSFGNVSGDFSLSWNNLTSLKGCPKRVGGGFYCTRNLLSNLNYSPEYIGGDFSCSFNQITSLENCPKHVGTDFRCSRNKLTSLDGLPVNFYIGEEFYFNDYLPHAKDYSKLLFGYIGGKIDLSQKTISDFLNENKNPPKKDLPRLLSELRKIQL